MSSDGKPSGVVILCVCDLLERRAREGDSPERSIIERVVLFGSAV